MNMTNRYVGLATPSEYKSDWTASIPIMIMALFPFPLVVLLLTAFVFFADPRPFYFFYRKPKYVIKIQKSKYSFDEYEIITCYIPKYIHPNNETEYIYNFGECSSNLTPRLTKAFSGNFLKTER